MTNLKRLKEHIKEFANQQVLLKQQRKTKHLKVPRTLDPYKAWGQHQSNRFHIFHLLIAYAKLRGREDKLILKEGTDYSKSYVNTLLAEYGEDVCTDQTGS